MKMEPMGDRLGHPQKFIGLTACLWSGERLFFYGDN
nr:MAG TPA: hypothetical protein [Caudoviricetes sp.]